MSQFSHRPFLPECLHEICAKTRVLYLGIKSVSHLSAVLFCTQLLSCCCPPLSIAIQLAYKGKHTFYQGCDEYLLSTPESPCLWCQRKLQMNKMNTDVPFSQPNNGSTLGFSFDKVLYLVLNTEYSFYQG